MQEPWLLHDFAEDFYGENLRLLVKTKKKKYAFSSQEMGMFY
jgi:hypothetical protein